MKHRNLKITPRGKLVKTIFLADFFCFTFQKQKPMMLVVMGFVLIDGTGLLFLAPLFHGGFNRRTGFA